MKKYKIQYLIEFLKSEFRKENSTEFWDIHMSTDIIFESASHKIRRTFSNMVIYNV